MTAATAKKAVAVTGHATDALPQGTCDALQVGTGGTVVCKTDDDATDVTFTVPDGGYVLCRISHVRDSSTATGIVALYK